MLKELHIHTKFVAVYANVAYQAHYLNIPITLSVELQIII